MAIDKAAIREHIRGILAALGDDPDREGLKIHRTVLPACMKKFLKA